MAKRNNRNIRLSDEIVEMIESQQGVNFTQKFENLVTRCMWELPNKEKQLAELQDEIDAKRAELRKLSIGYMEVWRDLSTIKENVSAIRQRLDKKSINKL